ncbi:MAG: hypothetical protein KTR15_14465 [Phycisphaeraceae bacterium]|nr:hypothetical protein [Phycisphaeraceae bacterium]
MRPLALLALLVVLAGCAKTQLIDRATLDQRYQETQLAEGVLSIVPPLLQRDARPPVVVNWWYAGTRDREHRIVYRELTWDRERKPVGVERRYRIAASELAIAEPRASTTDEARWLPLYEAAGNEIEPPADLPTARKAPKPIDHNPIKRPDEPLLPPND